MGVFDLRIASTLRAAAVSSVLGSSVFAAPVTIDFDGLGGNVVVGNAFSSLGVTFQNARTVDITVPGSTPPNTIWHETTTANTLQSDPISAIFDFAVASVSLTGVDIGFDGFILKAFDAVTGGSLVDTQQVIGTTSSGVGEFFDLTVTGASIFRVEFSQVSNGQGGGDGSAYDNFRFEAADPAPVPLPASLPLLLGALAVGGAAMRRARKS
ncbi:MAG: hypothetical protein AAGL96_12790 [Pseudomonadota bacterium]